MISFLGHRFRDSNSVVIAIHKHPAVLDTRHCPVNGSKTLSRRTTRYLQNTLKSRPHPLQRLWTMECITVLSILASGFPNIHPHDEKGFTIFYAVKRPATGVPFQSNPSLMRSQTRRPEHSANGYTHSHENAGSAPPLLRNQNRLLGTDTCDDLQLTA